MSPTSASTRARLQCANERTLLSGRASSFASENPQQPLVFHVDHATVIPWLQAEVRGFVRQFAPTSKIEWAFAIAVSEAATNIQKFAARGEISLMLEPDAIVFVAEDDGPGIDPEVALRDGVSEGIDLATLDSRVGLRGLGTGLGAIKRLMTELRIERRADGGTRLVGRRRI
jgi:serine/threonine-protein kinase RsbT